MNLLKATMIFAVYNSYTVCRHRRDSSTEFPLFNLPLNPQASRLSGEPYGIGARVLRKQAPPGVCQQPLGQSHRVPRQCQSGARRLALLVSQDANRGPRTGLRKLDNLHISKPPLWTWLSTPVPRFSISSRFIYTRVELDCRYTLPI